MFHSPRCVTGGSPIFNMPATYSKELCWVNLFRLVLGHLEKDTCLYLGMSKLTLWRYLRSYLVTGNVNTRRIGRLFGSVQFKAREELIITETVLVSVILFGLNRVKLPAYKKRYIIDRASCIMDHRSNLNSNRCITALIFHSQLIYTSSIPSQSRPFAIY